MPTSRDGRSSGAERLCRQLLEAGSAAPDWRTGFRAALGELLRFVAEQPLLARALFIDVRADGGAAWDEHRRAVERLVGAVDAARREPGAIQSTPPLTAELVVGAIEESIRAEIAAGRAVRIERLLPSLAHLAVLQYFGEDEARLELASARAASLRLAR